MAPRAIRFGRGEALAAAEEVAGLAPRLLLVHGSEPARAAPLREALEARGAFVETLACPSEPDLPALERGLEVARGAGAVVSLGGGAAIDLGKALAALGPAGRPAMDHLEVVGRGLPLEACPLPFVAMPTTAGTGAEVTRNAVIGVPEARRKVSLRDPRMIARLAVVDPALSDGAPRAVTLGSGLDAVTQVIEPYLSRRANPLTDALCRAAIPRGLGALVRLMEAEDAAARDDLAWCSLAGGLALSNAGLGAVHGLAGPIGGRAPGAPHGAVCGALLPHVLGRNARGATGALAERMGEVRGWIGAALGSPEAGAFEALAGWSRRAGLPGLVAMGLDPSEAEAVAEDARGSSSMRGNPVELDAGDLRAILEAAA
jgi:alcohol dehydrogenase class IV